MADPLTPTETKALLDRHGLRLRRSMGQHFLVDANIVRRMVEVASVGPDSRVLEIGAGAGTLTRTLAGTGATVLAYEVDQRLRPVLAETVGSTAEVRFEDAASVDFSVELAGSPWVVVANLPYNVGTPIVLDLLRHVPQVARLVVMLQKEAVARFVAGPGSGDYGVPSVVVALHGVVAVPLRVPGHLFLPTTPVESAVAVIDRRKADPHAEGAIALAATAFRQRRKMLRSSLAGSLRSPKQALERAGVDPTLRAEDVTPDQWLLMAGVA